MRWESNFQRHLTHKAYETTLDEMNSAGVNIQYQRAELKRMRAERIINNLEEQYKSKQILMQDVDQYFKMLFFVKRQRFKMKKAREAREKEEEKEEAPQKQYLEEYFPEQLKQEGEQIDDEVSMMISFQLLQNFTHKNMNDLFYQWIDEAQQKTTRKNLQELLQTIQN